MCFRNAYNMVLHKYGELLYKGLRTEVDNHLKEISHHITSAVDEYFLSELKAAWFDHKVSMLMIRDILMYMVKPLYFISHYYDWNIR